MQGATPALRAELTGVDPGAPCCARAELATLLALAEVRPDPVDAAWCRVSVPGAALARRVSSLLERRRGTVSSRGRRVEIAVARDLVSELLGTAPAPASPPERRAFARGPSAWELVLERISRKRCCMHAHLRALMVAHAHLVNPGRGYHLELILPGGYPAAGLAALAGSRGLAFHTLSRRGRTVLYMKAWEEISALLGAVGAVGTMLSFEEVTASRRMREGINRTVNCEVSNLRRVSSAAAAQLEAIRWLREQHLLETLPERLQEVARLRADHPHDDLATLATRSSGLSRSGLFHRLRDLVAAVHELRASSRHKLKERSSI